MPTNIKTTQIDLTPELTDIITNKVLAFDKLVDLDDPSLTLDIEVGKTNNHHQSGDIYRAEFNIFYKGKTYRAESEKEDMQSAIDDAKEIMMRELRVGKNKKITMVRKGGAMIKNMLRKFYR
ncbi:MAG: HPF/RaiA family ribosome-associated protein [Candidatus Paceibacterota bacterium]